jgi:hypothetical protein
VKRQGVARISEQMRVELQWHRYTASWQPEPDAPAETFYSEDGPGWNDVEQAVAWGRQHAPIVYVRLGEGLSEIYNAGERDDGRRNPTGRWPGSRRRRARDVHSDYGGVVYIDEQGPSLIPTGKFRAIWELNDDDVEEHEGEFDDVEAAVDWGRERAPVVLVAELPSGWIGRVPTYEIRSAGDEDPEGEPLERLRPGHGQETLEWSFSTQRAVSGHEPREFADQLETALQEDETVWNVRCELREESPMAWSFPAILVEGEEEPIAPPPIRGWIDVSFYVAAPLRKRAFEVALRALHRGLTAGGETDYGYTGNFDLHAVG